MASWPALLKILIVAFGIPEFSRLYGSSCGGMPTQ